tara:strand:- start:112 stop:579 length:468 start_codon:yes stop_codon:yes gene_type:complete
MTYRANNKKAFFSLVTASGQVWANDLEEHSSDFTTNSTSSLSAFYSGYYLENANGKDFKSICECHPSINITNYTTNASVWITLRLTTSQTDRAFFAQARNFEAYDKYSGDDSLIERNEQRYTLDDFYLQVPGNFPKGKILLTDDQTSSVLFFGRS